MSRSGYSDDVEQWDLIRWRGAVKSATRGKRGQRFFRDLVAALDALPSRRLIDRELRSSTGEVCALGCVGVARGVDVDLDPEEHEVLAGRLNIAEALVKETAYMNDDAPWIEETPEERWLRMRAWAEEQLVIKGAAKHKRALT